MGDNTRPPLRPMRIARRGDSSGETGRLSGLPEPSPAPVLAPNRSDAPASHGVPEARDELRSALEVLETFWDSKLGHKDWCNKIDDKPNCECGLNGLRRYLRGN